MSPTATIHWLTAPLTVAEPAALDQRSLATNGTQEAQNKEITFKIRHTPEYLPGTLEQTSPDTFIIHSKTPIHGVAPGQFCVIYDQHHHRCLGSAEITI